MDRRAWIPIVAVVVAIGASIAFFGGPSARLVATGPSDAASTNGSGATAVTSATQTASTASAAPSAVASGKGSSKNVFSLPWGTSSGSLGKSDPKEGNPEAPMSVVVDKNGTSWVLDQVNQRIVRIGKDGKVIDTIPIHLRGAQDLALAKDGSVLVLDRLADKQIAIVGPDGKVRASIAFEGKGIPEPGAVTGVFTDGDKVYVEREHQQLVLVGDTSGNSDPDHKEIPGRPSRDGTFYVNAYLTSVPGMEAIVSATDKASEAHRFTRKITSAVTLEGIVLLDTDAAGIIYLGVLTEGSAPQVMIYCLEPTHGAPLGTVSAPANTSPHETFRELTVLDSGGVLYMSRGEGGVTGMKLDCSTGG
ncbi:MAG: hypothetical protein ACXVEE_21820 [Polyangiales bacterium]